jgi:endonuclease/exonuclease/phosphatase family metal-dependent hydrolase
LPQVQRIYFRSPLRLPEGRFWRWLRRLMARPQLHRPRALLRRGLAAARPTPYLLQRTESTLPAPAFSAPLTVISANLWHDWPRHRRQLARLEAFASMVEAQRAGVLLLQEVTRNGRLEANEWLAERLGMGYVYGRANGSSEGGGFEEGLAIFSHYPLADPRLHTLAPNKWPFVHRVALSASIELDPGRLRLFSVHLGQLPGENRAQIMELQRWVESVAGDDPALIGGDFNAPEDTRRIGRLRSAWLDVFRIHHGQAGAATHTLFWPWGKPIVHLRLDYLFLRPGRQIWQVCETRLLETPAIRHSDHRAVLARLSPQARARQTSPS